MKKTVDVAVIGAGPAGLAAALKAKEQGASVLLLERNTLAGGILQQCIHNGFGLHYFGKELTGPEYAQRFIEKLEGSGIECMMDTMVLEMTADKRIFAISANEGVVEVQAGAIVLAMGCRERTRGALNIPGTRPAGIYSAGCAQRLVNMEGYMPGKRVVVLGSGDIGLIMARRMTWEGAKVEMVLELMPYSSGLSRNIVQCLQDNDIPLKFSHTIVKVHGRERVTGITYAQVDENRRPIKETETFLECDTLLLSVGLIPENELTAQVPTIEMDAITAGAKVDQDRQTTHEGIFACGNVLHVHDLVDNVSVEAQIAGEAAARYAKGELTVQQPFQVRSKGAVRYVVPHRITRKTQSKTDLYFRVGEVVRPARITVACGDSVLLSRKINILTPGEMGKISVDLSHTAGDITVEVKQGGV